MDIKLINTQRVLSPTQITLADYAVNPYRGCELNCLYCYARKNKNSSSVIGVKINAPEILRRELKINSPQRVVLGTTTECFQPLELKYRLTENILRLLNEYKVPYTILTKSYLIQKYLPIIAENMKNRIYFTFNTHSDMIIQSLERKSAAVKGRLETIKKILSFNIDLRLHIGPYIPYLTDLEKILSILPQGIEKINLELYHHKMGNFDKIKTVLCCPEFEAVYTSSENYYNFAKTLKDETGKHKTKYKFFLIVPGYDDFYNRNIKYE